MTVRAAGPTVSWGRILTCVDKGYSPGGSTGYATRKPERNKRVSRAMGRVIFALYPLVSAAFGVR